MFSHAYYEDVAHTVAVVKNVTGDELSAVIVRHMDGAGKKVVVEDEANWVEAELEDERWG